MKAQPLSARAVFGRRIGRSAAILGGLGLAVAAVAQTPAPPPAPAPPVMTQAGFDGLHVMRGTPDYVTTKLGRLHYWSMGDGPALILIHQAPLFGVEFAKAQPLLAAKGFRVIAVDIPGYGFSERPTRATSGEDYAESLAAMLDKLGIKQAAVAGTHTGATIALAFAVHQPARISCLVLQSVPVYSPQELAERLNAPAADTTIYGDGRQIQAWWQGMLHKYDFSQASPESLQWLLVGSLLAGNVPWYGESTGRTFVSRAFDSAKAIPQVKVPTLMLSVDGDHLQDSVARALKLRPDFAHINFGGPHAIVTFDRPELWANTVGDFVDKQCPAARPGKH